MTIPRAERGGYKVPPPIWGGIWCNTRRWPRGRSPRGGRELWVGWAGDGMEEIPIKKRFGCEDRKSHRRIPPIPLGFASGRKEIWNPEIHK